MNNNDLAFIKLLLIAKGGKRGREIAKTITVAKPVKPKAELKYRTVPDYKPREEVKCK